jgi:CRISPR-associated protein Csb2
VGVWSFLIQGESCEHILPEALTRALRRAVMARVQDVLGEGQSLPLYFTGHEPDGAPARSGSHAHIAFVADLERQRLLVIAPHVFERRAPTREESGHALRLDAALVGFVQLRAAGTFFTLVPLSVDTRSDPLFAPAVHWESCTVYRPTCHARGAPVGEALRLDALAELQRRHAPQPAEIEVKKACEGPRGGLTASLRLSFKVAVPGPLLLGRMLHFGGGLFGGVSAEPPRRDLAMPTPAASGADCADPR